MINSEENITSKIDQQKSEIQKLDNLKTESHVTNILNVVQTNFDNSIIINFNQEDYSFKVYNVNKIFLGSFTNKDFIKFITNKIYPNFFLNIGSDSAFPLIKKYICDVIFVDEMYKIKLLNYLESPFMADIEMIIKLYQGIVQLNDIVKIEIEKINDQFIKSQIIKILKQLAYVILNYSLKFISQISSKMKDDGTRKEMKDKLLKQSIMIVYKLNTFMRDEIDNKTKTYKSLQDNLIKIGNLKIEMYKKINELEKSIVGQNEQLLDIKNKFNQLLIKSTQNTNDSNNFSLSDSDIVSLETYSQNTKSSNIQSDNNSSYMFNDSDCYYTESGDTHGINYLSPKN